MVSMKRVWHVLLPFYLFTFFALATGTEPPPNPIAFLIRALEREAQTNLRGEVLEKQIFPPRANPEQTRAELPAPPPLSANWIRDNFYVRAELGETIAGRETWRISLEPKNTNAPSFNLWIDQKWLLRLAIQERDSSGDMTFDARFISLGSPKPRQQARQLMLLEPKPKLENFVQRETGVQLPQGFNIFDLRPRTVGKNNLPALELRASNGISVLVLVFAPIGTSNTSRIVSKIIGNGFIWVIGNLARAELEKTAGSVKSSLDLGLLLSSYQNLR
jgi:negative regulator of sigma E activity